MNFSALDLNLLRVLDALLRERSTVRAGERIGLSQPAVSSALARLRHALGDPLFVMRGRQFEPTEFAESLALPLNRALSEIEALLTRTDFQPERSDLIFRISGADFFAFFLMPRLADFLAKTAPGIRVQLIGLPPDDALTVLERHVADVVILPVQPVPAWVETRHAFTTPYEVVARRDHPRLKRAGLKPGDTIPLDLFCDLGHVLMSPEGNLRALTDAALDKVGRSRRVVMTVPFFAGAIRAVAESDLVSVVPRQFSSLGQRETELALDAYKAPVPVPPARLMMAWSCRTSADPGRTWMRDRIIEHLAALEAG